MIPHHWKYGFCILIIMSPGLFAGEYGALPAAPQNPTEISSFTYWLTLEVNGRSDDRIVPVVYRHGHYFLEAGALTRNHVQLSSHQNGLIDINSLPHVRSEYDSVHQVLRLTVPDNWLPVQEINGGNIFSSARATSSTGMLFNYDVYWQKSNRDEQSVMSWLEPRLFSDYGWLSGTGTLRKNNHNGDNGYRRYDTTWHYSDENHLITYQAGDVISDSLTWSNSVRMGGLRISRNFGIRPDLVTRPLLQYNGKTSVPGSVELFINDYRTSRSRVDAGPYTLTSVPWINGSGEATVVTTDVMGRQSVTTVPFYVSDRLLQKGFSDFDFSVGALRENYGLKNTDYSRGALSQIYRYGINNSLTLSGHSELSDGLSLAGMGSDIAVGRWGTFSNAFSMSGTDGRHHMLGYSWYSRLFSLSVRHSQHNNRYKDLSTLNRNVHLSRKTDQVTFTTAPFGQGNGSLGASYFDIYAHDGSHVRLTSLTWSRTLWQDSSLSMTLSKISGGSGYSAQMLLTVPFGGDDTVAASLQKDSEGHFNQRFSLNRAAPDSGGLGWDLGYGTGGNRYHQAELTWDTTVTTLQGGIFRQKGNKEHYWGELKGAFVSMDDTFFATNRINDAFIVVSTEGYGDVPVRYENRNVGKTNKNGYLLVPRASAWYPARLEIDTLNLPFDAWAEEVERRVAVREGSGMLVSFPVKHERNATIHLTDITGKNLPAGGVVTETNSGQHATLGYGGQVYFNHLPRNNTLLIPLPGGDICRHTFTLPERTSVPARVGPLACKAEKALPAGSSL